MTYYNDYPQANTDSEATLDLGLAGEELPLAVPQIEVGYSGQVAIDGDQVVKVSNWVGDEDAVLAERQRLLTYAELLSQEPIAIAPLRSVTPLRDGDSYRISHTQELVRGPSVASLPEQERQRAVARIVGQICLMSTVENDPDKLRVGIDAVARNWHVAPNGVNTLIDIYPTLLQEPGGLLQGSKYYAKYFGSKSGVITRLLHSSITPSKVGLGSLTPLKSQTEAWMYDAVPEDADPTVREAVHNELRHRFAPFIGAAFLHKAQMKLKR